MQPCQPVRSRRRRTTDLGLSTRPRRPATCPGETHLSYYPAGTDGFPRLPPTGAELQADSAGDGRALRRRLRLPDGRADRQAPRPPAGRRCCRRSVTGIRRPLRRTATGYKPRPTSTDFDGRPDAGRGRREDALERLSPRPRRASPWRALSTPSAASAPRTMPSASRPAWAYMTSGLSWSWKMSGRVRVRTFRPRSSAPVLGQELQHEGAEAAHRALLDRDQRLVLAGQAQDQLLVQRLGEAGVGDGGGEARARPACRPPSAHSASRVPKRQDGHRRALAHDAALADLQRLGRARGCRRPTPSPRG